MKYPEDLNDPKKSNQLVELGFSNPDLLGKELDAVFGPGFKPMAFPPAPVATTVVSEPDAGRGTEVVEKHKTSIADEDFPDPDAPLED